MLLGLSLFFGLAFEGFYSETLPNRPGGIRTFPLLSLCGAILYAIEPHFALAFVAGLLVLGAWLANFVRIDLQAAGNPVEGRFIIPISSVIAYLLGAVVLTQPLWVAVSIVVATVLLVGSRAQLHALATKIPQREVLTAGQFLILVGVVLPLLYNLPPIDHTAITPFKVWLAVVAVSTLSYASYLIQKYVLPQRGILVTALLGGMYSSTATTVVLARMAQSEGFAPDISAGMVAATAMMYVRIEIVCAIFNFDLARALVIPTAALAVISLGIAFTIGRSGSKRQRSVVGPDNPLQLSTAFVFAFALVAVSLLSTWVQGHLGRSGVFALAAVVGFTDIDPFVLSLAQGGVAAVGVATGAVAILIASASNDMLKALYAVLFSRRRESWLPALMLVTIAALSLVAAAVMPR